MKQAVCIILATAWLAALLAGCTKAPAESAVQAEPTPAATAAPTPTPAPSPTATPDPTATPEPAEYTPGVSTESGIPDFRSGDGVFQAMQAFGHSPEYLLSIDCLRQDFNFEPLPY